MNIKNISITNIYVWNRKDSVCSNFIIDIISLGKTEEKSRNVSTFNFGRF